LSDFALDASAALAWCFANERDGASEALLARMLLDGETAEVPALWPLEIANVLALAERQKRIAPADVAEAVTLFASLPVAVDDEMPRRAMNDILALARRERLSSYDAAYLELAMRRRLPLATRDDELKRAARRAGVRLIAC